MLELHFTISPPFYTLYLLLVRPVIISLIIPGISNGAPGAKRENNEPYPHNSSQQHGKAQSIFLGKLVPGTGNNIDIEDLRMCAARIFHAHTTISISVDTLASVVSPCTREHVPGANPLSHSHCGRCHNLPLIGKFIGGLEVREVVCPVWLCLTLARKSVV